MNKLGIGDIVEVINYGSIVWWSKKYWQEMLDSKFTFMEEPSNILKEDKDFYICDISPDLVGQQGMIDVVSGDQYGIKGIKGKHAWYDNKQLKLISKNPNNDR